MSEMPKRRRIELFFPTTSVDEDASEKGTWRNGKLSDWILQVGDKIYPIHRYVFGQGLHNSAFLAQAFTAHGFGSAGAGKTDLTPLLPLCCQGRILEAALDFAYTEHLQQSSASDLVFLAKVGDVLQMRTLLEVVIKNMNQEGVLSATAACEVILALSQIGGIGSGLQEELEEAAAVMIASNFSDYSFHELAALPVTFVEAMLNRIDLSVNHEDEVFDFVFKRASIDIEEADIIRLFQKVRFGRLSPKALTAAAQVREIPHRFFAYILVGKSHCQLKPWLSGKQVHPPDEAFADLGEWRGASHFLPRPSEAKHIIETQQEGHAVLERTCMSHNAPFLNLTAVRLLSTAVPLVSGRLSARTQRFIVVASVAKVEVARLHYMACQELREFAVGQRLPCNLPVDSSGRCRECNSIGRAAPRLFIRCLFADALNETWLPCCHEAAANILGMSAEEVRDLENAADENMEAGREELETTLQKSYHDKSFILVILAQKRTGGAQANIVVLEARQMSDNLWSQGL